ncbi:uncharacterized protein BX663DRAFT_494541 [Cokeromyces recurvatus]|uniref:uncharacterized protein n=1 Tax=Cokeromyces recurvatus TaxID=90255 RepID=UPI00221F2FA6|nr:uncharacterized protein BX663DRAFT_494541 [Cokeromyces recurvatus]KAI7907022.1 hypothetical protein BX663DRAFT_494541 [Cokeromyces recurvatus]
MFLRSRNRSSKESVTSSLSSGNASIITPLSSTASLYQKVEVYNIQKDEIIDLQQEPRNKNDLTIETMSAVIAAAVQLSSTNGSPSSLSLGNASIVKSSTTTTKKKKKRFSSLLSFSSSSSSQNKKQQSNYCSTSPLSSSSPTTPDHLFEGSSITLSDDEDPLSSPRISSTTFNSHIMIDDGRDELLYRGIQIKEIKTTLKPLVISNETRFPLPEVKLERPSFARISY